MCDAFFSFLGHQCRMVTQACGRSPIPLSPTVRSQQSLWFEFSQSVVSQDLLVELPACRRAILLYLACKQVDVCPINYPRLLPWEMNGSQTSLPFELIPLVAWSEVCPKGPD